MTKASQLPPSVRFGDYELDTRSGELSKGGTKAQLREQPLQILVLLLERRGELVSREDLRSALWPSATFVDFEDSLNHAIRRLRESLGDSAEHPRFIETLPRRGYRFIAAVDVGADLASAIEPGPIPAVQVGRPPDVPLRKWRIVVASAGGLATLLVALFVLNLAGLRDRAGRAVGKVREPPLQIQSIAVLPLVNLSNDPEQEYFADGMTEELVTNLGKISALRVISRTSVMHYKGTHKTLPEIARELNVDALVEGTVLRSGNHVRITANLLHAPSDRHLWAEIYERDLRDVLGMQDEVAAAIAQQVKAVVTPQERARLVSTHAVKPEAYQAYLKGTYAFAHAAGPNKSIQYLRQAIAADPTYAQAYVALGLAYASMGFGVGPLSPKEAFAQTQKAALQALKLDASLAEARSCLAWVEAFGGWDWAAAERDFRNGIELGPNSVLAHRMFSWYLSAMGRHEEAIRESHRARGLDPVSPQASFDVASAYWWARQYERCAAEAERLAETDPTLPGASRLRGLLCLQAGSYDQAIHHLQREIALSASDSAVWPQALLGCAYGRANQKAEALKILDELESSSKHKYFSPYLVAVVCANLGNKDSAFGWLEKAYAEQNTMLAFLRVDGVIDPLRSDPRFQELVRRMNFPP